MHELENNPNHKTNNQVCTNAHNNKTGKSIPINARNFVFGPWAAIMKHISLLYYDDCEGFQNHFGIKT